MRPIIIKYTQRVESSAWKKFSQNMKERKVLVATSGRFLLSHFSTTYMRDLNKAEKFRFIYTYNKLTQLIHKIFSVYIHAISKCCCCFCVCFL